LSVSPRAQVKWLKELQGYKGGASKNQKVPMLRRCNHVTM